MSVKNTPVGIMLVNFGVPESPDPRDVGKFIRSYMADGRVFGFFGLMLHDILHWNRRAAIQSESAARFADLYAFGDGDLSANATGDLSEVAARVASGSGGASSGSAKTAAASFRSANSGSANLRRAPGHFPYMKTSAILRRKVECRLFDMGIDNVEVLMSFRYGEPSMRNGFKRLEELDCKRIIVMPLYPQSSYEFTASVHDELAREQRGFTRGMEFRFVDNFYKDPGYISAVAQRIRESIDVENGGDKVVFAFRTISTRDVRYGDTYELQTSSTALAIANELGLDRRRWTIAYIPYNHIDTDHGLKPDIDETVERFGLGGVRNVAVVCPGQVVDSVDTLYEIDERMRQRFEAEFKGDSERCRFTFVPALGDSDLFADAIAGILKDSLDGWEAHYRGGTPRHVRSGGGNAASSGVSGNDISGKLGNLPSVE